jgi:N-acetylmuramoyl-L-alanine amidase
MDVMLSANFLWILFTVLLLIGIPAEQAKGDRSAGIMLDPGHGGVDGGTQSPDGSVLEKDLNLILAKRLAQQLLADGMQVGFTRERDEDVTRYAPINTGWGRHRRDLYGRVEAASQHRSLVMISIHGNHGTFRNRGAIVFYNPASLQSFWLANELQNRLNTVTGVRNTPRRGSVYYILKASKVPTVLVEYGYLSNPEEVDRLLDPAYQQKIMDSIRQGLWGYFVQYHF